MVGAEGKDAFTTSKCDLQDGIEGVRSALRAHVSTLEEPGLLKRLRVRVRESLACLKVRSLILPSILPKSLQPKRMPL